MAVLFFADHFLDDRVPGVGDLGVLGDAVLHDLGGRKASRRWISVTLVANLVRNVASSTAESPPPTTPISFPR